MLWQRVITALLLLPLILGAILFLSGGQFALAMVLPVMIAGQEWVRISGVGRYTFSGLLVLSLAGVAAGEYFAVDIGRLLLYVAGLFWIVALFLVLRYPAVTGWFRQRAVMHLIGLLLLVPTWYAAVHLQAVVCNINGTDVRGLVLLGAFVIVWGADVGAYFAGRAFGKQKLAPLVSPGKSVAGAVGGMLFVLLLALAVAVCFSFPPIHVLNLLLLVFVVTPASILGDLFESMIKREAGVKDSGTLLPGHGGMLDRIDSATCALPVFALGLPFTGLL